MRIPQHVTMITVGAPSLGWTEREGSDDGFTAYDAGTVRIGLYPLDQLGAEAAPGAAPPSGWSGCTFTVNVESEDAVDEAFRSALEAGAQLIADPVRREWGGYSGYVADPEGNRWEIAWAPQM